MVSNRYLKLIVDIGSDKRQVVSAIRPIFDFEEAIGKKVIYVANVAEEVSTLKIFATAHGKKIANSSHNCCGCVLVVVRLSWVSRAKADC